MLHGRRLGILLIIIFHDFIKKFKFMNFKVLGTQYCDKFAGNKKNPIIISTIDNSKESNILRF